MAGPAGHVLQDALVKVGSLVGTVLGIYNVIRSRRQDRRTRLQEESDWQQWAALWQRQERATGTLGFRPEPGSPEHKWAERMVAKGRMRRDCGMYTIEYTKLYLYGRDE